MGGEGSGRKPDVLKMVQNQRTQEILFDAPELDLDLPNLGAAARNPQVISDTIAYGELCVEGNTTADSVASGTATQLLQFDVNGLSSQTTPDHTEDHIVIDKPGKFLVNCSVSFLGDPSVDWSFHVQTNNGTVEFLNLHFNRKLGAGGDIGSASISGLAEFSVGDTVEVWYEHGAGVNKSITVQDCTLSVVFLGN